MRPVRLSMQAFGPYSERQTLDFRVLKEHSLFLIHGPTGSGKTTILDAICYALYGESSGNEREASAMRSHHSQESLTTEIQFEFTLGNNYYRIIRVPEQKRLKVRGTGFTVQQSSAVLWKIDNEKEIVIADKWSRVTEKVESLLGFKSDQFRQVALLPQGQFRKFLSANSQERQQILAVLFKTEWYRRIEEKLKEEAKGVREKYQLLNDRKKRIIDEHSAETIDQIITIKEEKQNHDLQLASELDTLQREEIVLTKEFNSALLIKRKLDEFAEAFNAFTNMQSRLPEIEQKKSECENWLKADRLRGIWDQTLSIAETIKSLLSRINLLEIETTRAKNEENEAATALIKALEQEPVYEKSKAEFQRLEEMHRRVLDLDKVRIELLTIRSELKATIEIHNDKKTHREKVSSALLRITEELERIRGLVALVDVRKKIYSDFIDEKSKIDQCESLHKRLETEKKSAENFKTTFDQLSQKLSDQKNNLEQAETVQLSEHAAQLASRLKDGQPCPVCGALEHPQPAEHTSGIGISSAIQTFKKDIKETERCLETARTNYEKQYQNVLLIEKEHALLTIDLSKNISGTPIEEQIAQSEREYNEAVNALQRFEKLTGDQERGVKALEKAERDCEEAEKNRIDIVGKDASINSVIEQIEKEIPEDLRNSIAISKQLESLESRMREIVSTIKASRIRAEQTIVLYAQKSTELNSLNEQWRGEKNKYIQLKEQFINLRNDSGFTTDQAFIQCLAPHNKIEARQLELSTFQNELHAIKERLQRVRFESEGLVAPDIVAVESKISEKKQLISTRITERGALSQELKHLENVIKEIRALDNEIDDCNVLYSTFGSLAEVSNGANSLRITFERFVLSSLLDEVLYAGSRRLRIMSKGRYDLQRALEHSDQRTAGGLELLVFDSYTGTNRNVNTLSGGESFLAALSLALGLADVVQSYAGGIRLDTIFIDEGFGSLDTEALDCAFRALLDLRETGRMVGIISHVPELRERIDVRLEVSAGKNGSSARFVV